MALSGVLVVDLTHVVAGPMATKTLHDLGARVIKVENPKVGGPPGDVTRYFEPRLGAESSTPGASVYFAMLNCGKESIVLQLDPRLEGSTTDREVFEAMLSRADVLVENFRPGVLDTLGYSWEVLHAAYPRLILASLSGFGQSGPYAHRKAVDTIIQGMSGFIASTGFEDKPVKVGTTVSDLLAGVYCATGVLAALHQRSGTGLGTRVDVAMLDTSFAFHAREFANFQVKKAEPPRLGNTSPIGVYPFDVFECRDGESFAVNCAGDRDFATFCTVLGVPELTTDPLFSRARARWVNREELKSRIAAQTLLWERDSLLNKLLELRGSNSFPVGPVNNFGEIATDPQIKHRGMLRQTQSGRFVVVGNPIKITGSEEPAVLPDPPELGADGVSLRAEFTVNPQPKARL